MSKKQTRHEARIIAFGLIFQKQFNDEEPQFLFEQTLEEYPESKENSEYIKTAFFGVLEKEKEICDIIAAHLGTKWRIDRISKVSLAVMKLAVFEMKYIDDVPVKAAINEAVEIEKTFDEPDNSAFVNGVLGSICREL